MLLKEKIERYENDEIEIFDVLIDDKGSQVYSLDKNVDELIDLFEMSPGFKEKCYIFNSVFLSHFDENRKSPEKLEKFLNLFLEKDSLNVYVNNVINGRRKIFLNILPLLSDEYLEKNKSWLWKNINILDIDSENTRNIFFNEYCNNMYDGIIDYVFSNIVHSERNFERQTLYNTIETIKLINKGYSNFIDGIKKLYPDSYNEKMMNLFFVNIEVKCSDESIKDYTNYLIKIIKKEDFLLGNIILSNDIEHILTSINPVIFDCMLDEIVKNEVKVLNELVNVYQGSDSFKFEDNSNYEENRSCLFIKKSVLEKRELLDNLSESDKCSDIKRRL